MAKNISGGGPQAFGVLVASIGAGAVGGAFVLPKLRERFSRDALVAAATFVYAGVMLALATVSQLVPLSLAMAAGGVAWITVLSSLQVAAQMALPNWVRSRGLAVFMTVFMGSMAVGSLVWGKVAEITSIPQALTFATAGSVIAVALSWRWRISGIEDIDLTPSMHWPSPAVHQAVTHDRGPVLIAIRYNVSDDRREDFLAAIRILGKRRRRDGAFAWSVFEHAEERNRFIESFSVESWLEHLRQHERVTDSDRVLQSDLRELLEPGSEPVVSHYVAPRDSIEEKQ